MIQTLLHNRWPLIAVLADESVSRRQYLKLSSENWLNLEDLSKVLEQLEVAMVFLRKENDVSIFAVLPVVYGLVTKLAVEEDDSSCIKQLKIQDFNALKRRWGLDSLNPSEVPLLATAVDPRFCNLKFLDDKLSCEVRLELLTSVQESTQPFEVQPQCKKTKTAFDILFGKEE